MHPKRLVFLVLICLGLIGSAAAKTRKPERLERERGKDKRSAKERDRDKKKKKDKKICKKVRKNGKVKKECRYKDRGRMAGHGVPASQLRTEVLPRPSGNVKVFVPNLQERVEVNIYREDGSLNQEALAQLDRVFRCRRTGEERAVDPRLYETLSRIQDNFEGKEIYVTSGFRFQRNEGSRHFHGSAMDISIPGVSYQEIYDFAHSLDTGGMGIGRYPHSGFVHIDFRAPGQPSYRWTDTRRDNSGEGGRRPSQMWKRKKPNS